MGSVRLLLLTGVVTLTACGTMPTSPATGTPELGLYEVEFNEGSDGTLGSQATPVFSGQTLTDADQPCVVLGSRLTRSFVDFNGKRYLQATYAVNNTCSRDLTNLTFVAVRRVGSEPTLDGTAITSMTTFGGTYAALHLAKQILPAQPAYVAGPDLHVEQSSADLQILDDTPGGELDGLQAQVQPDHSTYDLLPYGFVSTSSAGGRTIPMGGTGYVTFSVSVPIQATHEQDVFRFKLLLTAATNNVTSVTQGLEEQDAAGKVTVEERAAALPGAEIRTLLGPSLTSATMAQNSLAVCRVRTAGPRSAPTATLVDAQGYLNATNESNLPAIVGGVQRQPHATLTVNGNVLPIRFHATSLTPAILSVSNNLVHPVAATHSTEQVGTVGISACGNATSISLRTSPYTSFAAGGSHNLALKPDKTVVAWGLPAFTQDFGQAQVPAGLSDVIAVTAGALHNVALKSDGTVTAWGDNQSGELAVPTGLSNVVAVSANRYHTLALKTDGTVVNWGSYLVDDLNVPSGLSDVVAIAAGGIHNLALKADGTVVAWGINDEGQATVPAGLSGVIGIAAGGDHSLALKSDGTVVAWGSNRNGGPNGEITGQATVPAGLSHVVAIAAGRDHSLALKSDGTVVSWGLNDDGQANVPAGLSDVIAIAAQDNQSWALKADGTVVPWGSAVYLSQRINLANVRVLVP